MSNDSEAEHEDAPASDDDEEAESPADAPDEAATTDEEATDEEKAEAEAEEVEAEETEAEETAEAEPEEEETDGLEEGEFVEIAYTARTTSDGQLVDTTDQEVAEEEGVDQEGREFAPRTIVLGEGHIFESVENSIIGSQVGDTGTATVPKEEAFGEYDDEQVRTISKDKIPEDDRYPGAQVQIDGQEGFVETIIGGRARVDFNHPLAGEELEYEWEVVDTIEDREEKAHGLIEMMLDVDLNVWFQTDTVEEEQVVEPDEDAAEDDEKEDGDDEDGEPAEPELETVEVEKESLYIDAEPYLTMNQQWMMQKQQICQDLIDALGVDRVVIQEVIEGGGMGPGMMGGAMGGMGGQLEEALEEADIDADEIAEELDE